MWGLVIVATVTIFITHYVYKWRNPKTVGVLPPGSMGLPLLGETLQLLTRNESLDLHPFVKSRIQRYGPVFSTNMVGRPVIVSADPQLNKYLIQQEGRAVQLWYLDSFQKLFNLDGENSTNAVGLIHKYVRDVYLGLFGVERLKTKILVDIERIVRKTLLDWSAKGAIEVKNAGSELVAVFGAKYLLGLDDDDNSNKSIGSMITNFVEGLLAIPINIPGTKFNKSMKDKKKLESIVTNKLRERMANPKKEQKDFLDRAVRDINSEFFITEHFLVSTTIGALFATVESGSTAIGLAFKFFAENPWVIDDLEAEHAAIISKREDKNSPLTWEEYKSMKHTLHFANEVLRLGNVFPGIMRKAMKDIPYNGYTIPAGWIIMIVTSTLGMNPEIYKEPLSFNPRRWQDIDAETQAKNFMPFGGGTRQCAGAELAKAFFITFIHVLISEYKFTKVKGGTVARTPMLVFEDGVYVEITKKHK